MILCEMVKLTTYAAFSCGTGIPNFSFSKPKLNYIQQTHKKKIIILWPHVAVGASYIPTIIEKSEIKTAQKIMKVAFANMPGCANKKKILKSSLLNTLKRNKQAALTLP